MLRMRLTLTALVLLNTGRGPSGRETAALHHAQTLDPPWPIEAFELVDHAGAPFSRNDLTGGWTVLFSGFTHCPTSVRLRSASSTRHSKT